MQNSPISGKDKHTVVFRYSKHLPIARQTYYGLKSFLFPPKTNCVETGGTTTAEYCYEVFLKHLCLTTKAGMKKMPRSIAELGPGDSLGIGLAGLLAGADEYNALDVVNYTISERNLRIFGKLTEFFATRRPNPSWGWPNYDHMMDSSFFPREILTEKHLRNSLAGGRIGSIRNALKGLPSSISIDYRCPWTADTQIKPESVDWIFSQSVMEHVDDIGETYAKMYEWLRPGGFISHQIDFRSHGMFRQWNGHWGIPSWHWRLIRGRRPYLINRAPYTCHTKAIAKRFELCSVMLLEAREKGISENLYRQPFDNLSDKEKSITSAFIVAMKK